MRRYGNTLDIAVSLLIISVAFTSACAPHHPHEVGALTMPKAHTQGQPFQVSVFHGCYDGDTCTVTLADLPPIFGDHITVRFAGIDTPEIKGTCEEEKTVARQAQAFTQKLMVQAQKIELQEPKRDKYFRILAKVMADGQEIAQELIKAGLAVSYDGGKKKRWCEHDPS